MNNAYDIDTSSLINDINDKLTKSSDDTNLNKLRNQNHDEYISLDIKFLKNVDSRYKNFALELIKEYDSINSYQLLSENINSAKQSKEKIGSLKKEIDLLKDEVRKDLMSVIDYVDVLEKRIDINSIKKNNPLGILIKNKYSSLKLFSSSLDLDDLNFEMQHQSKRLIYIKEIEELIKKYKNNNTIYNKDNTANLINNLYTIIGEYLYLLTNSEFCYTKEAIKKILSYDYEFVDKYIPTYKIILNKIWDKAFSELSKENYNYLICNMDLTNNELYLLNRNNIDKYDNCGYICKLPKEFLINCEILNKDVLEIKLPLSITEKYQLKLNFKLEDIKVVGIYSKDKDKKFDSLLPVVYVD